MDTQRQGHYILNYPDPALITKKYGTYIVGN